MAVSEAERVTVIVLEPLVGAIKRHISDVYTPFVSVRTNVIACPETSMEETEPAAKIPTETNNALLAFVPTTCVHATLEPTVYADTLAWSKKGTPSIGRTVFGFHA
mgnify:FL=1